MKLISSSRGLHVSHFQLPFKLFVLRFIYNVIIKFDDTAVSIWFRTLVRKEF